MASGFGLNGGPSRCFNFWQEVLGCYVVNAGEGEAGKKKCLPALEDYHECLHHKKEAIRTIRLQEAYQKAEASNPRENAPKAEEIRSLGLLGKEEQATAFLGKS
ncbi:NADH-ubiquinone oxidoreductase kd subunit [Aspergillus steynii IBT 23096]|uniref:NADH dehydrogenase [ubiquinone] iron-sulfur protein 5 n=1 Tax=Aspergillus steynii IBT 23096 TaxID=1392250 RepID=A0A2I2G1R9_9EURO|nr:NADH-ubiquinone oxidoreductase kd subunit [Aspergillus steynii IBT 23096]PLB46817.1 NADH-ubiquinone oxidoreductase kd subunit [Aspergillus steynii IBT 23096]